ncbi:hypothetical protein FBEOM_7091 [Fusarium beomiforme]|uniref:Uncharacterized protein n=1 Tax=Fusarium beomiforme TaxID=44412 RepID=A0A9P5AIB4_9HYPO|nr:hypothetical protein FBEOM_7091 [Fusarium beomiforme]
MCCDSCFGSKEKEKIPVARGRHPGISNSEMDEWDKYLNPRKEDKHAGYAYDCYQRASGYKKIGKRYVKVRP